MSNLYVWENIWLCCSLPALQIKLPWKLTKCYSYFSVWNRQPRHFLIKQITDSGVCQPGLVKASPRTCENMIYSTVWKGRGIVFFFLSCSRLQGNEEENTTEHAIHKPVVSFKRNWQVGSCLFAFEKTGRYCTWFSTGRCRFSCLSWALPWISYWSGIPLNTYHRSNPKQMPEPPQVVPLNEVEKWLNFKFFPDVCLSATLLRKLILAACIPDRDSRLRSLFTTNF